MPYGAMEKRAKRPLPSDRGLGSLQFGAYRNFRIPSVALEMSPLMVTVNLMLLRCSNSWSLPKKVSILLVICNARNALLLSQMASRRHLQVTRDCSADPVILITAGLVLLLSALLQTMEHFRVRNQ